jgi:hypothetical protein
MAIEFTKPEGCLAAPAHFRESTGEYTVSLICGDRRTDSTGDLRYETDCEELAAQVIVGFCVNCPNKLEQTDPNIS